MARSRQRGVDAALLAVAVVWGSSYLTVKDLATATPVLGLLAVRFLLSSVALGALSLTRWRDLGRRELGFGVTYGLLQAVVLFLEAWGVTRTSASNGGLIISLAIILTPIYEGIARRFWLPPRFFGATIVAFAGVACLVGSHHLHQLNTGDAAFLVAALLRTAYFGSMGLVTSRGALDTRLFNFVACLTSALAYLAVGWHQSAQTLWHLSAGHWVALLYLSLVSTVVAFLVQTWAIKATSASRASLLMGTEPLWAVLVAIVIGGEHLGAVGAIGALLVLGGTFYGQRVELAHRERLAST